MSIPSLLPSNATRLERNIEQATARMAELPGAAVPSIRAIWNPTACPAQLLPWLAQALSVEPWDIDWPEWRQRTVIAASISMHRIKGTVAAIKQVISAAGFGNATVLDKLHRLRCDGTNLCNGTHYLGDPTKWAYYRIQLDKPITNQQAIFARALLDETDRGISYLDAIDFTAALFTCNGAVMCDGTYNAGVA